MPFSAVVRRSCLSLRARPQNICLSRTQIVSEYECRNNPSLSCRTFTSSPLVSFTAQQRLPTTKTFSRRGWVSSPAQKPPIGHISPETGLPLTNLPYFVRRTPSNQLPVYTDTKAGGTLQQTKLQKVEGNVHILREHLARQLGIDQKSSDVSINQINGHIIVKGWRKPDIQKFLIERGF